MSASYVVLVVCSVGLLAAGVVERRRHQARLRRIPLRILVNGTRGKSSITRLCAAALRAGGFTVVAKTTGTAARVILPGGTEEPIRRRSGMANIAEQLGVTRQAVRSGPARTRWWWSAWRSTRSCRSSPRPRWCAPRLAWCATSARTTWPRWAPPLMTWPGR